MNLVERRRRLAAESMAASGPGDFAQGASVIDSEAEDTDDIDSEDPDIYERTKKFERLLKKFNKHREEKLIALKGNDLRYNVYLKKMEKLARKDLGLDVAAYKDYVHNLKEFAHINNDLNVFATENMNVGVDKEEKSILDVKVNT